MGRWVDGGSANPPGVPGRRREGRGGEGRGGRGDETDMDADDG